MWNTEPIRELAMKMNAPAGFTVCLVPYSEGYKTVRYSPESIQAFEMVVRTLAPLVTGATILAMGKEMPDVESALALVVSDMKNHLAISSNG